MHILGVGGCFLYHIIVYSYACVEIAGHTHASADQIITTQITFSWVSNALLQPYSYDHFSIPFHSHPKLVKCAPFIILLLPFCSFSRQCHMKLELISVIRQRKKVKAQFFKHNIIMKGALGKIMYRGYLWSPQS